MRTLSSRTPVLLLPGLLAILSVAKPASGQPHLGQCCGDWIRQFGHPTMKLVPISFPPGSAWYNRFSEAVWAFNATPTMWFSWSYQSDNENSMGIGNGENEVGFFNSSSGNALARVEYELGWCDWPGCDEEIKESDIRFYGKYTDGSSIPWNANPGVGGYYQNAAARTQDCDDDRDGCAPAEPIFVSVTAAHELLHASGLADWGDR